MRSVYIAAALLASLTTLSSPAYAYLDPGTGSVLLQGLIAGVAAGTAAISLNYYRLKTKIQELLGKKKNDKRPK